MCYSTHVMRFNLKRTVFYVMKGRLWAGDLEPIAQEMTCISQCKGNATCQDLNRERLLATVL